MFFAFHIQYELAEKTQGRRVLQRIAQHKSTENTLPARAL